MSEKCDERRNNVRSAETFSSCPKSAGDVRGMSEKRVKPERVRGAAGRIQAKWPVKIFLAKGLQKPRWYDILTNVVDICES